ncbi:glutamate 5-kinase [Inmirania thermothiophila]|uniref:Glutamate 5-kinase n=1 Tax=Inmirania thermothiophila TaxID=1750597 RepID=A0A3N1Y8M5_9GAMM|nr:glutamate 5-kinase [Inmirania thermothiophila]ROR35110.1 glutamate 5-kinase [Inmirania thermothiophila]
MNRAALRNARRWVVKIGSALLTADGRGLDGATLARFAGEVAALWEAGREVVVVSSGAVAAGMSRLGWRSRPHELHRLQAAAAVGQAALVQAWEAHLQARGRHTAQVLLTHADLADRRRYLNARSTLRTLLALGVVPVVNENDTVAVDEIRLGDNDNLAALVANLVEAEVLVILTDQEGLHERDPRRDPQAPVVEERAVGDPALDAMASGDGGALGRGGMATKLAAARRAARSGTATVIASGRREGVLRAVAAGERIGTLLVPDQEPVAARKRWLAGQLRVAGRLHLDAGAVRVLREAGRSLLPVGVHGVEGRFRRGELVACLDPEGREVARGLVNYDADEVRRIMGQPSSRIEAILGYVDEPELIHRDNLVLV